MKQTIFVTNRSFFQFILCWEIILIFIDSWTAVAAREFLFLDERQGVFANSLKSYEISYPTKVREDGHFLSHSLTHVLSSRRRREISDDFESQVHYNVNIEGRELHLQLRPNYRLFGPGLVSEYRSSKYNNVTRSKISRISDNNCHFVGTVKGADVSSVALATCSGLHGLIRSNGTEYFVEPVKDQTDRTNGHAHLIYRRSALPPELHIHAHLKNQHGSHGTCGVSDDLSESDVNKFRTRWQNRNVNSKSKTTKHAESTTTSSQPHHHRRQKRSYSMERNVETLVVVDQRMLEYYRNEDIENYVLTIMNMVSNMYHDATIGNAINIVLVRIIYLEEDEKDLKISHHADHTLASFCKWQMSVNSKDDAHPNHHDVAILLTRYNICSRVNEPCSTLGLSQVSGMCQPHRSCNINEDTGLALAFTVAHEMGHNFGMKHDSIDNGCEAKPGEAQHIMSPHLTAEASPLVWSRCSQNAITIFLDRDWGYCLNDEPSEHDFRFPVLPPGVMYDIDHQCRLQYGPEAAFCNGIDDLCTTVWCRVDKKCLTRLEAAVEGTLCGDNSWCFGGRCVEIGEKPQAIDGQWSEWGSWTQCSRTCGAGISKSERLCTNPPPTRGGKYCLGERKRYRICNVDSCPEGAPSFRSQQCASFNNIPYRAKKYEWEPVTTSASPCQLHCKPKGRFFSVMLNDMVIDGTPCKVGSRDMCISGRCRFVGCDWVLESNAKEDRCGICHGDGTRCKTIKQNFSKETGLGYVEATVIPEGARNIRVEEIAEANNYLAVRNDKGQYYLNGHWYIQWSGDYEAAGSVIRYKRDGNKESFMVPGPTKEALHIMLLFQSQNPGVNLEYTVRNENATVERRPEFVWKHMDWTHCTLSCGGGTQRSEVVCTEMEAGIVDDSYCNITTKPDDLQKTCNEHVCPARWWSGPWQHCSVTCGNNGVHRRTVLCVRQLGPDEQIALEDWECEDQEKPIDLAPCRDKDPCPVEGPHWQIGPWSDTCNGDLCAVQVRNVTCSDEVNMICDLQFKPKERRHCGIDVKCGDWTVGEWTDCTATCNGGTQIRRVICTEESCSMNGKPDAEQYCNQHPCDVSNSTENAVTVPVTESVANNSKTTSTATMTSYHQLSSTVTPTYKVTSAPAKPKQYGENADDLDTDYKWMSLFWKECSKKCGNGTRTREVLCVHVPSRETVATEYCLGITKPTEKETCQITECTAWTTGDWSVCSVTCGEGSQERQAVCPPEKLCDELQKPMTKRICQLNSCVNWTVSEWTPRK